MNGRLAVRDTVLPRGGGPNGDEPVYVPKGSLVNYSVYSMHRRTDFYGADAEEFRPERWEGKIQGWVSWIGENHCGKLLVKRAFGGENNLLTLSKSN